MELEGTYLFAKPRTEVWQALLDPAALRACLPGCERFEAVGPDQYSATVKIGLAAVKGAYTGTVQIRDVQAPSQYTLEAEGAGAAGFVKATTVIRLEEQGSQTLLHWKADARIGGTIAAVGFRMIGGVSKQMAGQFFKCLEGRIPVAAAGG